MIAGIEFGGTRIRCAVSFDDNEIVFLADESFSTSQPRQDINRLVGFLRGCEANYSPLTAVGIASFGPVDLRPNSDTFGSILKTPKAGWSNFPLLETIQEELGVPVSITTDVNGALLAEHAMGAAQGVDNAIYVTVGTGIGAGIMVNGMLVNGFLHPEVGHMAIPHEGVDGICPFHGNCLEGLASGPAIAARAGRPAESLSDDHPIWNSVADHLAAMCQNLLVTVASDRIVLGGGVIQKPGLLLEIRQRLAQKLNGYLPLTQTDIEQTVVGAAVTQGSGLMGALLLAKST